VNEDNLVFIINCNLQRLDGPVRGNGKIVQELGGWLDQHGCHAEVGGVPPNSRRGRRPDLKS
jgi:pyruvate dehydrogenase complex dehydrogenase (E1) component